ncbi:hypothetical protein BDV96DRAFT_637800 [Lophiotrema nucula]|uniref:Peptidase S8/S53 domain-containing protein n=1 Tax=Lophiotrema nucula TaxID=690887 RepID=A0A6A5YIG2_9PLEO|nr:hypothetical protein BDV96DRAFT_637800 [Lophiotrema nucula]
MSEKDEKLEAQLREAVNPSYEGGRRRIVFAAAGNAGGNAPMGWLASMSGVIAVHATDGLGAASNFNPTSLSGESFPTLGRDIQSNWKETGKRNPPKPIYLSGTSFATPIVAAIAADVLEWARWNLKMTNDQKKLLYSAGYMKKVFAKMMQPRFNIHYIQPWTLWERGWDNGCGQVKSVKDVLMEVIAS